ncbi:MAG: hypothetical protein AB1422_01070 [bacterium]
MGIDALKLDDYIKDCLILKARLENDFKTSYEKLLCSTIDIKFTELNKKIEPFKTFNDANRKIEEAGAHLCVIEKDILQFAGLDAEKTENLFKPIKESVEKIIKNFQKGLAIINTETVRLFKEISECSPGDGKSFQDLVLEFFDVIFIDEINRYRYGEEEPKELKKREFKILKRLDGFYTKCDSFDAKQRIGFEFQGLIIECKNKRPDINDLMQCFKYTLYFQDTELSKVPLTLLVGRDSPRENSSIWEINRKIFDKSIANETRLILILDRKDLGEMKENKVKGRDSAMVIKDKVKKFSS